VSPAQLGQHPPARQVLVHLSDTHLLAGGARLGGVVDTLANLRATLAHVESTRIRPAALVFTGDLTDVGEPEAYAMLRETVEPVAQRLGAAIVWVAGNHDERAPLRRALLPAQPPGADAQGDAADADDRPWDTVTELDGLRLIGLDTSVPGWHHGELSAEQLDWLAAQLAAPAARGTILALHHPPVPSFLPIFELLELRGQQALEEVLRGSDVRAILGGHLHYSTFTSFAGIPVSVSSASCYTMDISRPARAISGVDGGQAYSLVHVYEDRITHSVVPVGHFPVTSTFSEEFIQRLEAMTPAERDEAFSRKRPPAAEPR